MTLWSDDASALASLAQHVRSCWDKVAGTDGVPILPPADDRTAVDVYYGPVEDRCDEDYTLRAYDVLRHGDATRPLSLSDGQAARRQGPRRSRCRADEQLVQADGTVPVQVDVEDATVFTHPPAPAPTPTG
ncbi:hypothetical protein [Streptomyces sp. NPDC020571]|uniref:hypothetical protein n=1 Tax=Streptomyces sp. NPDC020571 TaxID=3365079 RepID=UPI0037AA7FD2